MTQLSANDAEQLIGEYATACSGLQEAARSYHCEQLRYAEIGQQYLAAGPYHADHNLMEYQRRVRDEAAAQLKARQNECGEVSNRFISGMASIKANALEKSPALRSIKTTAQGVYRRRAWLMLGKFIMLAALGAVIGFASKTQWQYAGISAGVLLLALFIDSLFRGMDSAAMKNLEEEVAQYAESDERATDARQPLTMYGKAPASAEPSTSPVITSSDDLERVLESNEFDRFQVLFQESLQLKDRGALASALRKRQEATAGVDAIPALYCVGKHHEMILEYNHIGLGIQAKESAIESLRHEAACKAVAVPLFPMFRSNLYQEVLDYLSCASTSFDEAMKYLAKLKEEFPSPQSAKRYQEMIGLRDKYSRWYSAHRAIASTFYSRVNAALDHGRYAGGLSVLDVILAHAQDPGYKLDYEEYVDVLDDVCAITIQLLGQMMERRPRAASTRAEADELACVVRNAIKYLTAFAPDCEPKSRDLFQQHCRSFADIPWIKHVPGWDELRAVMK